MDLQNPLQANTLAASLVTLDVPARITGGVLAALILVIVFRWLKAQLQSLKFSFQ